MRFDLHLHTTASDGHLEPATLVAQAMAADLDAIAVTDHDTTAGILPALDAARTGRMLIIPGVELSATHASRDVHILGYFVDPADAVLTSRLATLREARLERARSMVSALREGGYDITLEQVLALADGGSVGRSHVARALVGLGHVSDVGTAFEDLIGKDRPYYLPKPITAPDAVVRTITEAGGIAVMAHPGITDADDLIEPLVHAGLGGIEAFHADHSPEQRDRYARLARSFGLLVTGGSDFHGETAPGAAIGDVAMDDEILTSLLAAGGWSDRLG